MFQAKREKLYRWTGRLAIALGGRFLHDGPLHGSGRAKGVKRAEKDRVRAMLAADSPKVLANMRLALARGGIANPLEVHTETELRQALVDSELDLMVMSHQLDKVFAAPLIAALRRGEIGAHPFPIVIILVDDADELLMRRISDCGPDDVIVLSTSPAALHARISVFLSGQRKPLVVSKHYAGPDRRTKERAKSRQ